MAAIEIENLEVKYGSLKAVDDVSFSIDTGDVFGLLGPNGAGKTSILETIEGLRKHSKGSISVNGIDPSRNRCTLYEQIGISLQDVNLYKQLSVDDIVQLFASFYEKSLNLDDLIEQFLPGKKKSLVGKLSGGQKQRLNLLLAFINDPVLVFLDEPSVGLDVQSRVQMWDFIRSQNRTGKTFIIASHNMDEVEELCNRVAIIDSGKVLELDTPSNLVIKYQGSHSGIFNLEDVFLAITGRTLRD